MHALKAFSISRRGTFQSFKPVVPLHFPRKGRGDEFSWRESSKLDINDIEGGVVHDNDHIHYSKSSLKHHFTMRLQIARHRPGPPQGGNCFVERS